MDTNFSRRGFLAKAAIVGAGMAMAGAGSAYAAESGKDAGLCDSIKSADYTKEKHAPVIEFQKDVKSGEPFMVSVIVGKAIAHPNTTEHHISWAALYFKPKDGGPITQLAKFEFTSHGESAMGPNKGMTFTNPAGAVSVKLTGSGTFFAESYCNIHGLWQSSAPVEVI